MKNIFTVILFLSFAFGFGQESKSVKGSTPHGTPLVIDENSDYSQIFTSVQVQAIPPGGMNAYRKYIASSFKLPEVTEKTTGTVIAKFIVWDDGSIRDVVILKESPAGLGLGKEAYRILLQSPKWKPGVYKGRYVKQYYTMPISIQITPSERTNLPLKELKKEEILILSEKSNLPIKELRKEETPTVSEETIEDYSTSPEKQAEPIGGIKKFYNDLSSRIQVPEVEVAGVYKTKVKFVVNQDGSLSDFQILEETPINVGLGQNVIKYLQTIQNWIPSEQNGRKVRTYFVLPVALNIEPEIESDIKKKD